MRKSGRRVERLASSEGVGYSAVPDSEFWCVVSSRLPLAATCLHNTYYLQLEDTRENSGGDGGTIDMTTTNA